MKTTEEFIEEINKKDKKLKQYYTMCKELALYLKDYNIFPPDMTEQEKKSYYLYKGFKPDWSLFLQMWGHYLLGTWENYRDALKNA